MTDYQALGVRPVINAYATLTKFGGSLMPPEVLAAMQEAAGSFVDLAQLQAAVGERIAGLTRNEAAYVTSGAAAGLMLSAAASVLHHHPDAARAFPNISHLRHQAIILREHRNPYDFAVQQVGLRFVEIDATAQALRGAINDKTAAIFFFLGNMNAPHHVSLEQAIAIAGEHKLPVIVDAAAQLPPVENFWRFTEMGAALALFSGGKDLRGPQPTGLMLGRRDFIDAIRPISNPNHGLGRPTKVGKEEMMGLLAAVQRYLKLDHEERAQYCEDCVALWRQALDPLPGVSTERAFPNEAAQPLPRCRVSIDPGALGRSALDIVQALLAGDPAIAAAPEDERHFYLNPMTLNPGEELLVRAACKQLLSP